MKRGIKEFDAAHDPRHKVDAPSTVFEGPNVPKGTDVFIITSAQNATPVHADFWAILKRIEKARKASLFVIPLRYKNPTSQWTGSQQNAEWWPVEVRAHLFNQRRAINENLTILGDLKVQPTAVRPLTGAEGLSLASSGIIGHPKMQLRCIPTPQSKMAKMLTTTGACTVENYTDSRSGKIGEFHHSLSALVVERVNGKEFHLRQLHYDSRSKSVTDLCTRWTAKGAEPAPRPLALIMGDTHVDSIDPKVERATFAPLGGMVEVLRPLHLVYHDLLDAYSCNPHHFGNPFNKLAKLRAGADNVRAEVDRAVEFVSRRRGPHTSNIVGSNHNDMLRRWVVSGDWKQEPVNAEFYLETALAMVRDTKMTAHGTEYPDPFIYWLRVANLSGVRPVEGSFMLGGVELGMHGDQGPNGSRGSIGNHRRIGVKSVIGHSHTPGIDEGCYQVGTSTLLRLEYTHGPSSWMNCHCLLNADGKRQLIFIINGKWRA